MKKVINNYQELIEWYDSILLDNDFVSKVSCLKVSFNVLPYSFKLNGVLLINDCDLSKLPTVLKKADDLDLYVKNDSIKFHATFKAEQL